MYFSQNAIILVMLMFVISAVFYATIDYKTKEVEDEIKIKEVSLYEKNLINTIHRNIDKIVEDAFVNASYKIMKERKFFTASSEAVSYITSYIKNETKESLKNMNYGYSNISYNISSVKILPTYDPLVVHLYCKIDIKYSKKLNNGELIALKPVVIDKDVKLSRIPDPYVYLNKFYYTWEYRKKVNVNNFPNDNYNHTFCIILNSSNFNYSKMHNPNSPTELRIIGWNSTSNKWNVLLPYWVQTWREGNNDVSVIWIRANKNELPNGYIYILYNSTTPVDRQDPEHTFIFFDDFNYFNPDKWDSVGYFIINNSKITVIAGAGSSVYTKQIYGTGYELMFRANFTQSHAQGIGFFNPTNIDYGIGWDMYNTSVFGPWGWGPDIYMRVGNGGDYVPNGNNYLNKFYLYDIMWFYDGDVRFTIYDNTLNSEYSRDFINGAGTYPISINAIPPTGKTSNTNVTVDWIFLKDINDITTTVPPMGVDEYPNLDYKEEKPKTFTGTIYYGEPGRYELVYNSTYSIIGLFTNKTDYWYSPTAPGYKPLIEEN